MSLEWMIIRGSGIVAFALLAASVIWGLLVSSKLLGRAVKAKPLTWFHESLGIGALVATLVHVVVLSTHDYLRFGWDEILVPGRSDWRTLPVALGVAAFYGLFIITVSFYLKRFIGQQAWRVIHFGAFGVFLASLIHGITAGTDTNSPWVLGLYLGAAIVVFGLIGHRVTGPMSISHPPEAAPSPERVEV